MNVISPRAGQTIVLWGAKGSTVVDLDQQAEDVVLSGLFCLEEFWPYEPSAYHWEAGWIVSREGDPDPERVFWVDASTIQQQVNPDSWASVLAEERQWEFGAEDEAKEEVS